MSDGTSAENRKKLMKRNAGARGSFPVPFGMSLLFVTFLILCLFTFAAISLVTARNDYRTGEKNAEHQTAYYEAANQAEEKVAGLNAKLAAAGQTSDELPAEQNFQISVDDSHVLAVTLEADTDAETPFYRITRWEVESSADWQPSQSVQLIQPGL